MFSPPSLHFRENRLTVLHHLRDQIAGRSCLFIPCCPDEQIKHNGGKIYSFLRQPVVQLSCIGLFHIRTDDSGRFELLQTIRQNVRSNPFARLLEFFERPKSANREIADDQQ